LYDYNSPKYLYPKWKDILRGFKDNDKVYNWGDYVLPEDEEENTEKRQKKKNMFSAPSLSLKVGQDIDESIAE
jgi:hypothetical protein